MLRWEFKVGDTVKWKTNGHGRLEREGVIIALVPAGDNIANFVEQHMLASGLMPKSSFDRYAVEVPRLNPQTKQPVKSGHTIVMAPNKTVIEAQLTEAYDVPSL